MFAGYWGTTTWVYDQRLADAKQEEVQLGAVLDTAYLGRHPLVANDISTFRCDTRRPDDNWRIATKTFFQTGSQVGQFHEVLCD